MKMSKFSIKKKSKEIPTEAVIAYSKGNMLEKIGKKDQAIQSYIVAGNQNHVKAQYRGIWVRYLLVWKTSVKWRLEMPKQLGGCSL